MGAIGAIDAIDAIDAIGAIGAIGVSSGPMAESPIGPPTTTGVAFRFYRREGSTTTAALLIVPEMRVRLREAR